MNLAIQQQDMFPDRGELERAINVLTARFVWFYPKLTHMLGNPKAALLMCAVLDGTRFNPEANGWVFRTRDEWTLETGLGRREQETARETLRELGFLHEQSSGTTPRRLYLKADLIQLGAALSAHAGLGGAFKAWDWNNSALMLQLLGKPFGFYQQAAKACGSAQAAIYLSFLIFLQRGRVNSASNTVEWFTLPAERTEALLGLTYRMQRTARQKLVQAQLIDERAAPTLTRETQCRVRFGALLNLLSSKQSEQTHLTKYPYQNNIVSVDNSMPVGNIGENENLCLREPNFGALKTTKTPQSKRQKRPNESDINAPMDLTKTPYQQVHFVRPYIETIDKEIQQQQPVTKTPFANDANGGRGGGDDKNALSLDLVPEVWREPVSQALATLDSITAQAIADELAGRMDSSNGMPPMRAPLRYLDRLIAAAQDGSFRKELGIAVAQRREANARRERQLQQASSQSAALESKVTKTPSGADEYVQSDVAKQALSKLAALKAGFARGGVGTSNPPLEAKTPHGSNAEHQSAAANVGGEQPLSLSQQPDPLIAVNQPITDPRQQKPDASAAPVSTWLTQF